MNRLGPADLIALATAFGLACSIVGRPPRRRRR